TAVPEPGRVVSGAGLHRPRPRGAGRLGDRVPGLAPRRGATARSRPAEAGGTDRGPVRRLPPARPGSLPPVVRPRARGTGPAGRVRVRHTRAVPQRPG